MRGLSVGTGLSLLTVCDPEAGVDVAPAFDAGVRWSGSRFSVGIDASRLNSPMLGRDELPIRLVLSGTWQPAPEFAAAAELGREGGVEDVAAVCEFRPAMLVGIRAGVGLPPLRYAAGIGLTWAEYEVSYCLELNPALGATHSVQLAAQWR
jgi:hypothetical protein